MKKTILGLLLLLFATLFVTAQSLPTDGRLRIEPDLVEDSMDITGAITINTDLLGTIDCAKYPSLYLTVASVGTGGTIGISWSNYVDFSGVQILNTAWVPSVNNFSSGTNAANVIQISRQARYMRILMTVAASAGQTKLKLTRGQQTGSTVYVVNTTTTQSTLTSSVTTDISSATITTTATSATTSVSAGVSGMFSIAVTAASGTTPTMDLVVQYTTDAGTNWTDLYHFERITATGIYNSPVMTLPSTSIRYVRTVAGTTPSFTSSLTRNMKQGVACNCFQFFDRSIVLTTVNSTTPSFQIQGARFVTVEYSGLAATTMAWMQVESSDDNTNWQSLGTPIQTQPSTNISLYNGAIATKYIRARVLVPGSSQTYNFINFTTN